MVCPCLTKSIMEPLSHCFCIDEQGVEPLPGHCRKEKNILWPPHRVLKSLLHEKTILVVTVEFFATVPSFRSSPNKNDSFPIPTLLLPNELLSLTETYSNIFLPVSKLTHKLLFWFGSRARKVFLLIGGIAPSEQNIIHSEEPKPTNFSNYDGRAPSEQN